MGLYFVNRNPHTNGKNEVHEASCRNLPGKASLINLGDFKDCMHAMKEAKKYFLNVDGCLLCCRQCHKK